MKSPHLRRAGWLCVCIAASGNLWAQADTKTTPSLSLELSEALSGPVPARVETPLSAALSQEAGPGVSLSEALASVWLQNPQVRQAQLALQATNFDISGARAGYYPYIQVQASQSSSNNDSATTLFFVQPLWNGGLTGAQVDTAKANQLIAVANLNQVRLALGQRLLEAYFNVAQTQEQELQWESYVTSLRRLLASIERRAQEGAAPTADVQTALTRLKQAEAGAEAVRALQLANRAELRGLLNFNPGTVAWPTVTDALSEAEIERLLLGPVEARPERATVLAQIKLQEATARAGRAALWPEFSIQHREQVQGVEFDPTNSATLLVAQFQTNNGLRGLRSYQAETQRVEAVKAQLVAVDRDIRASIDVDRTQLKAARLQAAVQKEAADAAVALVDSFLRQFEVGRKSWLEVLNAQREANETLLQSIALKRTLWYYNARLSLDSMNWDRLSTMPRTTVEPKK